MAQFPEHDTGRRTSNPKVMKLDKLARHLGVLIHIDAMPYGALGSKGPVDLSIDSLVVGITDENVHDEVITNAIVKKIEYVPERNAFYINVPDDMDEDTFKNFLNARMFDLEVEKNKKLAANKKVVPTLVIGDDFVGVSPMEGPKPGVIAAALAAEKELKDRKEVLIDEPVGETLEVVPTKGEEPKEESKEESKEEPTEEVVEETAEETKPKVKAPAKKK